MLIALHGELQGGSERLLVDRLDGLADLLDAILVLVDDREHTLEAVKALLSHILQHGAQADLLLEELNEVLALDRMLRALRGHSPNHF